MRLAGITKRFGEFVAVDDLNLDIYEGEFFSLLGPSGCGKTTTLRMIAGFEDPTQGEISVAGEEVQGVPPYRRPVNTVFQSYAIFPHLNVFDNVAFGLRRAKVPKDEVASRVADACEMVQLEGFEKRKPGMLSGGQQQRVALARALAPEPAVVLLDEPFSNLDAGLRARVRSEIREILREAEVTSIFVTHDQEEALSLADEVAVMMAGTVFQTAPPEDLYHRPTAHEIAAFVGEANFLPGTAQNGRVRCALGEIPSTRAYEGEVEAMLRPEALRLAARPDGEATVIGREFYGHDQLIKLRLCSGTTLLSRLGGGPGFKVGERVSVEVEGPAVVFPAHASLTERH